MSKDILIVGVASLLWNGWSLIQFVAMILWRDAILAALAPAQRELITSLPDWFLGTWALGSFSAVVGSVLILTRSRFSESAFMIALICVLFSLLYSGKVSDPAAMVGNTANAVILALAVVLVPVALLIFTRRKISVGQLS